jgi:cysteine desulfurase/selenocysteine lyase
MDVVLEHERHLVRLASARLAEFDDVIVYGPPPAERSGVVSFTMRDVHPHDLATILDEHDVCVRAGNHCAQPLMRRLSLGATARASFYVYNDEDDVDALIAALHAARELFAGGG